MLNIVGFQKLQIKIILILSLILLNVPSAKAVERLGFIGQSWSFPLFFNTPNSFDEITYHLDTGYFLHEKWSAILSIDAQVDGQELFYLELGPDFYPVQDVKLLPYVSARLLYTMVPNGNPGWLVNMGFEMHLGKSYQIENLRLRVNTGGGQFLFDNSSLTFIELIRLGLIWTF